MIVGVLKKEKKKIGFSVVGQVSYWQTGEQLPIPQVWARGQVNRTWVQDKFPVRGMRRDGKNCAVACRLMPGMAGELFDGGR
jgi:hypothetical protein